MFIEYDVQWTSDGDPKDVQAPYQSNMTSSGRPVDVQWTSDGSPEDVQVPSMASLEGLKWTSILVLFGRTSCVSFGTSTRRPLNVPSGRPQVQYGRSIDVHWMSAGPLGTNRTTFLNNSFTYLLLPFCGQLIIILCAPLLAPSFLIPLITCHFCFFDAFDKSLSFFLFLFFALGFLSRTFTIHRERGGYFFISSVPFPTSSQTLRNQLGD